MYLKATTILPVSKPPLKDGVIQISGGKIKNIGSREILKNKSDEEKVIELNNTLLLPGFVNAHCHLELTHLGPLNLPPQNKNNPYSGPDFVNWIQELIRRKNGSTEEEVIEGIECGIGFLLKSGVTTVGDHLSFNSPWEIIAASPLRGRIFAEVLGIIPEVSEDIYHSLLQIKKEFEKKESLFSFNMTPHSVHAVSPEILKKVIQKENQLFSIHLAESKDEQLYFKNKTGNLAELIKDLGIDPPHTSKTALRYLIENKLQLNQLLLIHGNYLDDEEIQIIKKNDLSIVYCPGSHAYFQHDPFPFEKLLNEGVNIALGTDSITSNTKLDFLSELKRVKKTYPHIPADHIIKVATLNGAKALKMDDQIGSLEIGKCADIIGIPWNQSQLIDTIFETECVNFSMIDGKILIDSNSH